MTASMKYRAVKLRQQETETQMSRSTTSSAYQLQYMHKPSALLQPPHPRALEIGVAKEYTEPTSFSIYNFHVRSCVASCTGTKVLMPLWSSDLNG